MIHRIGTASSIVLVTALIALLTIASGCGAGDDDDERSPEPTPATPVAALTPSPTPAPAATPASSPTVEPTATTLPVPTPTADVTPPGRVTGIGAGSTGERCEIVVGWAPNPASHQVDHYNVYRSNAPGVEAVPANLVGSTPAEATHYTDTGLTPGTYYYAITAVDAADNEGPMSQEDVLMLTSCGP